MVGPTQFLELGVLSAAEGYGAFVMDIAPIPNYTGTTRLPKPAPAS